MNKPTGTVDGDLIIVVAYLESDTNTFDSVGTSFQLAGSIANTGAFKIWVYWKWASGEGASWTWTPTTNAWRVLSCASYSGGSGSGSQADVVGTGGQGDAVAQASQTAPSITTGPANDLVSFSYGNFSGTDPGTLTGFATNNRVSLGGCCIGDANAASASTITGTTNGNVGGSQDYAAIQIGWLLTGAGGGTIPIRIGVISRAVMRSSVF